MRHMSSLVKNQRAHFDYEILEKWEAGIVLQGFEVKSLKTGRGASLAGSHVSFEHGEAFLVGADIAPYQAGNTPSDYDSKRPRKLLLSKKELTKIAGLSTERGLTVIPLSLYNRGNKLKLELGLARGKKRYDKRESIKKREAKRHIDRVLKTGR